MGRPKGSKNKPKTKKVAEDSVQIVREDVMKPQPKVLGEKVVPKGGMAHKYKAEEVWGEKVPPYPRSHLDRSKERIRSGMMLVRNG